MADKNLQMTQRNATNTGWDNIFPITKAVNVMDKANIAELESLTGDLLMEVAMLKTGGNS